VHSTRTRRGSPLSKRDLAAVKAANAVKEARETQAMPFLLMGDDMTADCGDDDLQKDAKFLEKLRSFLVVSRRTKRINKYETFALAWMTLLANGFA